MRESAGASQITIHYNMTHFHNIYVLVLSEPFIFILHSVEDLKNDN